MKAFDEKVIGETMRVTAMRMAMMMMVLNNSHRGVFITLVKIYLRKERKTRELETELDHAWN